MGLCMVRSVTLANNHSLLASKTTLKNFKLDFNYSVLRKVHFKSIHIQTLFTNLFEILPQIHLCDVGLYEM